VCFIIAVTMLLCLWLISHPVHFNQMAVVSAMPWLSQKVTGLSPGRPAFDPVPVHVRYVWDKVSMGNGFLQVC